MSGTAAGGLTLPGRPQPAGPGHGFAGVAVEAPDQGLKLVTVLVGEQMLGIPIDKVRDVFMAATITPVPLAPRHIAGLVNLRGKVVTVLSMRAVMGMPALPGAQTTVGIERHGEAFGLLVDEVGEVIDVSSGALERNPPNMDARWVSVSAGVRRLEDRLLLQLDIERVFEISDVAKEPI